MKPFLLDSNVISELWKKEPAPPVLAWVEQAEWFIPAPVIAEIQQGAEAIPSAPRRAEVNLRLDLFLREHGAVILPWDGETARTWGRLRHSPEVKRRPQPLWDSLIDAMGVRFSATVATRDEQDFRHAGTFNPWSFSRPA